MTFEVQRLPAGIGHRVQRRVLREALLYNMPFEVEVTPEARSKTAYASPCTCDTVYRILDLDWRRRRELLRRGLTSSPCVCPCMGILKDQ